MRQINQLLRKTIVHLQSAFLLLVGCTCFASSFGQQIISGKVVDKEGDAIPFCRITVKNSKTTTQADANGSFTLVATFPATLVISAVNFTSSEITVTAAMLSKSELLVILEKVPGSLKEVVVTSALGYKKNRSVTGSVSSAAERKSAVGYTSPTPADGSIRLRGESTLSAGTMAPVSLRKKTAATRSFGEPVKYEREKASTDSMGEGSSSPTPRRTSLLTAGEVNDFKKWKMWEDYNNSDFKLHSNHWQLFPTQRYSVQLQNNQFKAIIGQVIYLVDKISNTRIWTAVTDNTGKAELWSGFAKDSSSNQLELQLANEKGSYPAIPFAQGINKITIQRACNVSSDVQISFVVDATGSMGDEIDYLKEELGDILRKVSVKDPSLSIHTSAVFYKDRTDQYVTRMQGFNNNLATTTTFIQAQSAGGGGDYPEAVDAALQVAIDSLEWNAAARTRIIFLLMDAPPHDEAKQKMASLIAQAATKGIRIVPVACSGTDKSTEFIMRSMALATNGTYLFLTDDSGIGESHIKPTTDEFKVELLNDLLQRTIEQMCYTNGCDQKNNLPEPIKPYNNPISIKLFPNPTNGPVTIATNVELKALYVTDFTGKIIMRIENAATKGQYKINLGAFPSATYLVAYITKEGKSGAEKVVLIH